MHPSVSDTVPSRRAFSPWIAAAAVIGFVAHAFVYLYFFVDDQGIPFVYAQNVLRGRGLVYNGFEGRLEGYSDFLHVWLDTLILAIVRRLHWPKYDVFFIGQGLSLLAGAATVALVFVILRRLSGIRLPGAVAALGFLALAGPLAVWSCSSLETATFAFLLTLFVWTLIEAGADAAPTTAYRIAVVSASLGVLERIDGFVYFGAVGLAFVLAAAPDRRRAILQRVALPLAAVLVVYNGWRIWYFGDVLPAPLQAKVLFKLRPTAHVLLTKMPEQPYWVRFAQVYGWPAVVLFVAGACAAAWRDRVLRAIAIAAIVCAIYVAGVGDWMFGFRFFVALLPMAALLIGAAVSQVSARMVRLGWLAAVVVIAWCGVSARAFERTYERSERKPSWLAHPSFDHADFFGTYDALADVAAQYFGPGMTTEYNQAGYVPFMLDLENIDDLGICSRFFAELPTTDVFFTEVGRYMPLTPKRAIRAGEAYLLYRDVQYIVVRGDLLRSANLGHHPSQLMGGYFEFVSDTPHEGDGIYRRTSLSAERFKTDPRSFLENLAHISYLDAVTLNGRQLAPQEFGPNLRYLRDAEGVLEFRGRYEMEGLFSPTDQDAYELDVNAIRANAPATVTIELVSASGEVAHREVVQPTRRPEGLFVKLGEGVKVNRLRVIATGPPDRAIHVWIDDLRLQGQTPQLARFIREHLRFPAPSLSGPPR